uniref:DDE_Tnp_1_7 domain-containing protein n=1 Tax=Glossina pallidipes TaxID=7398 RepID=A0A1A9ZMK5_GLOPL
MHRLYNSYASPMRGLYNDSASLMHRPCVIYAWTLRYLCIAYVSPMYRLCMGYTTPMHRLFVAYVSPMHRLCIVNGFKKIGAVINLNDNAQRKPVGRPNHDRLHKIRPVVAHLNKLFMSVAPIDRRLFLNEQICSTKSSEEDIKVSRSLYPPKDIRRDGRGHDEER